MLPHSTLNFVQISVLAVAEFRREGQVRYPKWEITLDNGDKGVVGDCLLHFTRYSSQQSPHTFVHVLHDSLGQLIVIHHV